VDILFGRKTTNSHGYLQLVSPFFWPGMSPVCERLSRLLYKKMKYEKEDAPGIGYIFNP
jgi:hypothetical protein